MLDEIESENLLTRVNYLMTGIIVGQIPNSGVVRRRTDSELGIIVGQIPNTGVGQIPNSSVGQIQLSQILAIKTHLVSPPSYKFLQSSECISFPHVHTLEKLYSSFGLENDFCTYLSQVTSTNLQFSDQTP